MAARSIEEVSSAYATRDIGHHSRIVLRARMDDGTKQENFSTETWLVWEAARVTRAKGGDRAAFEELYRAFVGPLYSRCVLPAVGNAEVARDVLADTFQALLEFLPSFEWRGTSLWFWLTRTARNRAMDAHRAQARTTRATSNLERLLSVTEPTPLTPREEYEQLAEHAELSRRVQAVFAILNPRYRRAIELRIFEELPREECAACLEVKLGTFDVLLLRALRAFRLEWERTGDRLS